MALSIDKIKSDFAKHQKKAMILGVLVLVLVGFTAKAYFEMAPRDAGADVIPAAADAGTGEAAVPTVDAEARMRQSKELWAKLRENRSPVPTNVAFSFLPAHYVPDPNRRHVAEPEHVDPVTHTVTPSSTQNPEQLTKRAAVLEKAARLKLNVMFTVMGKGKDNAVAAIGGKMYGVGDHVGVFEITAIRAREVDFQLDGITITSKMDEPTKPAAEDRRDQ